MSESYPNKAVVAYATILSSSPKANVGGVELGNQFCKVRINHPIIQDEPLVRPMTGYNIIGDAHAKGVPVAWPSICVCYDWLNVTTSFLYVGGNDQSYN
jgi:hypothetical protein